MIFLKENFHSNVKIPIMRIHWKEEKTLAVRIKPPLLFNQGAKAFHSTFSKNANLETNLLKLWWCQCHPNACFCFHGDLMLSFSSNEVRQKGIWRITWSSVIVLERSFYGVFDKEGNKCEQLKDTFVFLEVHFDFMFKVFIRHWHQSRNFGCGKF